MQQPEIKHLTLRFKTDSASHTPDLRGDLSAVVQIRDTLFLGADEGTRIERLVATGEKEFGEHTSFDLAELIDLPDDADEEIDIEGLAASDDFLWVVGSHSLKRKKVKPSDPADEQIARLATVTNRGNRFFLARLPITSGENVHIDHTRTAARLRGKRRRNQLTRALRSDPHLGAFLHIPGKDNGFDVEGIAVSGTRVFLGLRGPVLRGYAVVLELRIVDDEKRDDRLQLDELDDVVLYRKHFLDLNGLGVRDLALDGDDLLVLAGPTMTLDGDAFVFRWKDALHAGRDSVVPREALRFALKLPYGVGDEGTHHPEGIALLRAEGDAKPELLVVYDSPRRETLQDDAVEADVFPLD